MAEFEDRSHEIQDIELPPEGSAVQQAGTGGWWSAGDSAQINAGTLIAFDQSLSRQQEEDISNSMLFAQLAANAQADRFTQGTKWLSTFTSVLGTVGWNIQQFNVVPPVRIDPPVDWLDVVAKAYSGLPGASAAARAMNAAAKLPAGGNALAIWGNNGAQATRGNFIVQTCSASKGDVKADSAQVVYQLVQESDGFLSWATYYEVATSSTRMELNEAVYALVRKMIIDKLGDRPSRYVAPVPL